MHLYAQSLSIHIFVQKQFGLIAFVVDVDVDIDRSQVPEVLVNVSVMRRNDQAMHRSLTSLPWNRHESIIPETRTETVGSLTFESGKSDRLSLNKNVHQ